jgi:hypothetical protein
MLAASKSSASAAASGQSWLLRPRAARCVEARRGGSVDRRRIEARSEGDVSTDERYSKSNGRTKPAAAAHEWQAREEQMIVRIHCEEAARR